MRFWLLYESAFNFVDVVLGFPFRQHFVIDGFGFKNFTGVWIFVSF